MIRAHIRLETHSAINNFINGLDADDYELETYDGHYCVSAKSLLGVMYISTEHADDIYLINKTNDGKFPRVIDNYRI